MKFSRHSPVGWKVVSKHRRFAFSTDRVMVPVERIRNPFAGRRRWAIKLGRLSVRWD